MMFAKQTFCFRLLVLFLITEEVWDSKIFNIFKTNVVIDYFASGVH